MVKFQTVKQKARIILNSEDAVKTVQQFQIPVNIPPIVFDGALGTNVDINLERIHVKNHRFFDNEPVVYTSPGVINGLTNNANLFVRVISNDIFQLATAANGAAINLQGIGAAVQTLTRTVSFDSASEAVVDDTTLTLANHLFTDGDRVRYSSGTGTAIGGLTNNRDYFILKIDDDTISLCETFDAVFEVSIEGALVADTIQFTSRGTGQHSLSKIVSFHSGGSPVVNLATHTLTIPNHPLKTGDRVLYQVGSDGIVAGTAIGGLVDNLEYFVVKIDPDSIKLTMTLAQALSAPPAVIPFTAIGTGQNHSLTVVDFTRVNIVKNYRFRLDTKPFDLNDKCRIALQHFDYIKTVNATTKSIGGIYFKNLIPFDTYNSQGDGYGTLLLPYRFDSSQSYQNSDMQLNSISLPYNINNILHNNIDIFVDTKKLNFLNNDIQGCFEDEAWSLTLVVYEQDEFELINKELDTKVKNYINARLA